MHQWAHGSKSKGKGTKTGRLEETQPVEVSILPGMMVKEETRPKEGPKDKRQTYQDFLLNGRRDHRPAYSAPNDAWELVLGNMPKGRTRWVYRGKRYR